jgi:hypothetical protein
MPSAVEQQQLIERLIQSQQSLMASVNQLILMDKDAQEAIQLKDAWLGQQKQLNQELEQSQMITNDQLEFLAQQAEELANTALQATIKTQTESKKEETPPPEEAPEEEQQTDTENPNPEDTAPAPAD